MEIVVKGNAHNRLNAISWSLMHHPIPLQNIILLSLPIWAPRMKKSWPCTTLYYWQEKATAPFNCTTESNPAMQSDYLVLWLGFSVLKWSYLITDSWTRQPHHHNHWARGRVFQSQWPQGIECQFASLTLSSSSFSR